MKDIILEGQILMGRQVGRKMRQGKKVKKWEMQRKMRKNGKGKVENQEFKGKKD